MYFSIIIVCLNAGENLLKTVESVLYQTYVDYEIVVKDGFSIDGSIEQLPTDSRIKIVRRKDKGIYDAMNQGITESHGEYIIFMNAGDYFYDSQVLELLSRAISIDRADIYYGKSYNIHLKAFDKCPPYIDKYFCYRSMICHQATLYKAKIIKKRGYDISFKISADRERLMYAVIKENIKPIYVPINIAMFQDGGFSSTLEGKLRNKDENKRLIARYYTDKEKRKYRIKYLFTLPHLIKLLIKNIYVYRVYNKLVGIIYRT